jgi:hypothetical protein
MRCCLTPPYLVEDLAQVRRVKAAVMSSITTLGGFEAPGASHRRISERAVKRNESKLRARQQHNRAAPPIRSKRGCRN